MAAQLTPAYRSAYEKVEAARKDPKFAGMTAADIADKLEIRKAYYYTAKSLIKKEGEAKAAASAVIASATANAASESRTPSPVRTSAASSNKGSQITVMMVTGDPEQVARYIQIQQGL